MDLLKIVLTKIDNHYYQSKTLTLLKQHKK